MFTIKGTFKKKIYFNSDTGYIVGLFRIKNCEEHVSLNNKTITIVGYFHEIIEEDEYTLSGEIVAHDKYGEQFSVSGYEKTLPEDTDSIIDFLCSGMFKGIGEKTAKKIVDIMGKETLNIILEHPDNLLLIPGISQKQINTIHDKLVEYSSSYKTVLKLNELGFNTKDSMLIYNKYKERTFEIIDSNIYRLYYDLDKLSFKKIDMIARNNNIDLLDCRRVQAFIIYAFKEVVNIIGDCYLSIDELYNYVVRAIGIKVDSELYKECLDELVKNLFLIFEKDRYYLREIYDAEGSIVNRIKYLTNLKDDNYKDLDYCLDNFSKSYSICYNEEQKNAIIGAFSKHFMVITGGPGTGKTTIIKGIVQLYRELNKYSMDTCYDRVALLAPTGRASKRLSEASMFPASTIHRFLKWNKDNNSFQVNERNKSNVELVIVDEASMIDVVLFSQLLRGLRSDCRIIIVGDDNQLPSVGPGQVLKDIIESNKVNVFKLSEIYRQKQGSNIIQLAYDINSGKIDLDIFNKNDCIFIPCLSSNVMNNIIDISSKYIDVDYKKFQILAPMYRGINGIDSINIKMQDLFNGKNSKKNEISVNGVIYREGDKVIQLTNMLDDNVFNGDIGIIDDISVSNKLITIDFDGNLVTYKSSEFQNFKHAYSISIHKSQGSEFETIIIPIVKSYSKMLYRKLIYTAVTRSKAKLYLIGEIDALEDAVKNNLVDVRKTSICDRLIEI